MKKVVLILIAILVLSCSSHPGRVCGGAGGKRCVNNIPKKEIIKSSKRNS
jgi:hypothetical protein